MPRGVHRALGPCDATAPLEYQLARTSSEPRSRHARSGGRTLEASPGRAVTVTSATISAAVKLKSRNWNLESEIFAAGRP
jgi:hypothetical protein